MCLRQCFCCISTLYCPEKYSEHLCFTSRKTGNVYKIATCTNKIKNYKREVECTNAMITIREICFQNKPIYSLKCTNREKSSIYLGREKKRRHLQKLSSGNPDNYLRFRNIKKISSTHRIHTHSNICNIKYTDFFDHWTLYHVSTQKQYRIYSFVTQGKKNPYLMTIFTLKSQMLALNSNTWFISEVMMCTISPTLYL